MISLAQKLFAYIEIARVSVIFMGLPFAMGGAAYALTLSGVPIPIYQAISGVIAVFLITGAVHTIDDYFDRERDRQLWPDRQLPSRGLTPKTAIIIYVTSCGIGFTLASLFFNIFSVLILLIATIWATIYTGYLREKFGYLTLPFAIGFFPIGGYLAFAPNTLWSDPIPWLLYLMVFTWQASHILAYSPPHGVADGKTRVPMLFKRFSAETTLVVASIFAAMCMGLGIIVYWIANLSILYLSLTCGMGGLLICLSLYYSRDITVKNCMRLVFLNSMYGWLVFFVMTLEFLLRYDIVFFYITLGLGVVIVILTPILGGFGQPMTKIKR